MSDTGLSHGDATAQLRAKDKEIEELENEINRSDEILHAHGLHQAERDCKRGGRESGSVPTANAGETAAANPAAPDTSGEASPTRVASPPPCPRCGRSERVLVWCCPYCQWHYLPTVDIRALEDELAETRAGRWPELIAERDALEARAEKAEAEVERLREERDPWKYHGRSAEEWEHEAQRLSEKMDSLVSAFGEKMAHPRRVNPTSDTLGLEAKG